MDNQPQSTETQTTIKTTNESMSSVYPQVATPKTTGLGLSGASRISRDEEFKSAAADFNDALAAVFGVSSYLISALFTYVIKTSNVWAIIAAMGVVATIGLVFAFRGYSSNGRVSPLSVIGVAAATTSLLYVLNVCLVYLISDNYSRLR